MTNALVLLVYSPFLIMSVILMVSVIMRKDKTTFDYTYITMAALIIGWTFSEMLLYCIPDANVVAYLFTAKFVFVVYVPLVFFLLVARFYNVYRRFPRQLIGGFFAVATVFAVGVLVPGLQVLFRSSVVVVSLEPLMRIESVANVGYVAMLLFSQIPIIGVAVIVLRQRKKLPAEYRSAVTILLWSLILYVVGSLVYLSGIFAATGIDFSIIAVCLVNFFFYVAIAGSGRPDYLNIWRGDIFNYLDEAVLIVAGNKVIVDANDPAKRLFASIDLNPVNQVLGDFWDQVKATGKTSFRELEGEDHSSVSSDLYFLDGEYSRVYQITQSPIANATQSGSGEFVILNEVTRNRLFIERLQGLAGVDSLTGLYNRFRYEELLKEWDRPENLPLSIIIGDVNGLKTLNDTQGHKAGDQLLIHAAETLRAACPEEGGMVARIGGDEFVMVLKRCSKEDALDKIRSIQASLAEETDFPFKLSIALGSATKSDARDNINALYVQADRRMYADKRAGAMGR